jgi:hypothetical protein
MKRTVPLTAGIAALALAGAGVFAGQALSLGDPTPTEMIAVAGQNVPSEVDAVPTGQDHAAALTAKLTESGVLQGRALSAATPQAGPMVFRPIGATSADGYKATAVLNDDAGKATLTVFVQSAKKQPECTPATNCFWAQPVPGAQTPEVVESEVTGVHGSVKVTKSVSGGAVRTLSARTTLADGTVVTAVVRAEVEEFDGDVAARTVSSRAEVPLTEEQIVAVVDRPGFHF